MINRIKISLYNERGYEIMTIFEFEDFLDKSKQKFQKYLDGASSEDVATFEIMEEIKDLTNSFEIQTLVENLIEMRKMAS